MRVLFPLAASLILATPAEGQAVIAEASAETAEQAVAWAAEAAVAEAFPHAADHLEVRVTRLGLDGAATDGLTVRLRDRATEPRGRTQVDVWRSGEPIGWALLHVAHFDSVLVAGRRVRSGEAVGADALTPAYVETTRFREAPVAPADLRAGDGPLFATRYLSEGAVLRAGDLRPAWAADTGDAVRMRYERGGLRLTLACKAREPGHVGDIVRLYAPDTDAQYRARLTGPGQATWVETL